ncbi:MAG: DUF1822 family protein [Elainella sp. C42_A2020_010]|nr:DUF1822 family protein [Elainella sp. C42_A2020_010]
MNQTIEPLTFTVPLSFAAHAMAQQQGSQTQPTYLKALAVYAVDFYLRCMGIETDLEQSDWHDPWMAKLIDVADLRLKPYGKLECCVVQSDAEVLSISPDAEADRIGYMAVQLEPTLKSATLLGFTPTPAPNLPLTELQSLEQFLTHLQSLAAPNALTDALPEALIDALPDVLPDILPVAPPIAGTTPAPPVTAPTSQPASVPVPRPERNPSHPMINLRNWLEGIVETGWQPIEQVLGSSQMPMVAVRSQSQHEITVRQAKLIDVGMELEGQSVVLSLAITLNPDTSMNVLVQLYPAPGNSYLPPHLKLTMLSEAGELLQEICSREQDSYIQLRHFRGEASDIFEIQVSLGEVCISESFVL